MGGVGREGHECEAEVHGADAKLELAKGLDEHRRLDVPDSPAHLDEAHVRNPTTTMTMSPLLARCNGGGVPAAG